MAYTIVIFGASGDLTSRKLVPALYELRRKNRLPPETRIVGFSRTPLGARRLAASGWPASTAEFLGDSFDAALWRSFAESIFYQPGDIGKPDDFPPLAEFLCRHGGSGGGHACLLPLDRAAALRAGGRPAWRGGPGQRRPAPRRLVIEKPFGTDLATCHELNEQVHRVFSEHQIYRIDHYLGKETVQNILVLRFANSIFEPIWNRNYIDHVQITAAEDLTVGHRAAYYDSVGVLRDMFQNHLMQLMTLTAMEAPTRFEADTVRDEKVKVLRAVRLMKPEEVVTDTVRGPVPQVPRRAGRAARQRDGHLRRGQAVHRQLAVAGRAVPAAQRQGDGLPHAPRS